MVQRYDRVGTRAQFAVDAVRWETGLRIPGWTCRAAFEVCGCGHFAGEFAGITAGMRTTLGDSYSRCRFRAEMTYSTGSWQALGIPAICCGRDTGPD